MIKRLWFYIRKNYPLASRFYAAVISFYSLYFTFYIISGHNKLTISWASIMGMFTFFFFLFFLRVSDELKDYEIDKKHFPERLVPSGKVKINDIKLLFYSILVILLVLNFIPPHINLFFIIPLIYSLFMYKYFFLKKYISKNLILAFVSHNPVIYLLQLYIISIVCREYNISFLKPDTFIIAILFWLPGVAWELARKIRAPEDEDDYETYSKIFGYKIAALLPLIVCSIFFGILLFLINRMQLSIYYIIALAIVFVSLIFIFLKFIFKPSGNSFLLKPVVQVFFIVAWTGIIINLIIKYSIHLKLDVF